eukprot:1443523-Lingulodinium_polyedra.AAC.1
MNLQQPGQTNHSSMNRSMLSGSSYVPAPRRIGTNSTADNVRFKPAFLSRLWFCASADAQAGA